jgi:ribosome recycling factor
MVMIKCEKGQTKVEGEKNQILAEYTCITKILLDNFNEEQLKSCIKYAKMSEEEIDNEIRNIKRDTIDLLFNLFFKQEGNQ